MDGADLQTSQKGPGTWGLFIICICKITVINGTGLTPQPNYGRLEKLMPASAYFFSNMQDAYVFLAPSSWQ
jgi:hypothetical protein